MSFEKLKTIPYQPVADSPGARYYTDWRVFEPYLSNPSPPAQFGWDDYPLRVLGLKPDLILKPTQSEKMPKVSGADKKKVLAFHLYNLKSYVELTLRDSNFTLLVPKPGEGVFSGHISVNAYGDSTLTILYLAPEEAQGLNTISTDVNVAEGSRLALNFIFSDASNSPSFILQNATLASRASLETLLAGGRGQMVHLEVNHELKGRGSRTRTLALLAAGKNTRITLETSAETSYPDTEINVRSLGFAQNGFIAHKGFARARRGASGSKLEVRSRLVALTPGSKVYGAPELEIESDEPSEASHSVAQGPLDPEQIFYLESRGLSEQEALNLLIRSQYSSLLNLLSPRSLQYKPVIELLLRELTI